MLVSGGKDGRVGEMVGIGMGSRGCVTPPTQHQVSSEGVIFFYKLITFKFVHSYNVKHLTCTIFCSSGLQNIYKLLIWKCSTFIIFTLFTKETKTTYTKIYQKVF